MQHTGAFWIANCVARWKSCCKELIMFFQNEENQILYSMCPLQMRRMMSSGREEMDCLMIGKRFTDQGLDTQIYASYAAHQLWGTCKRKLCFCDRFSNTTDKMILNERNWIVLLLYFKTAGRNCRKKAAGGIAGHQASEGNTKAYLLFEHDFCS